MEFVSIGLNKQMGNSPIGFLPSQIAGLVLWSRFNSGITVTGAGVSQWDDVSGEGNHLKQGTDTNRPSKEADGSVLFDGSDNYLKADAFTFEQPETIYILGKQITWTLSDTISDGNAASSGQFYQSPNTPGLRIYAGIAVGDNNDLIANTYSVMSVVFNGASSSIQINNETATTGDAGAVDMSGFTLGAKADASQFANIQVKEVVAYNTVHNATEKAKVIKYLADVGDLSI